jgi:hypothetical protein
MTDEMIALRGGAEERPGAAFGELSRRGWPPRLATGLATTMSVVRSSVCERFNSHSRYILLIRGLRMTVAELGDRLLVRVRAAQS